MAQQLTKLQWIEILLNERITNDLDLAIFQVLYSFENHCAYASQIGLILGNKGKTPHSKLNLEIGRYAKRIAEHYEIGFTVRSNQKYKYWDLFFYGWNEGRFFIWQLKPDLIEALKETGLTGVQFIPEEIPETEMSDLYEGAKKTVIINAYERNLRAKKRCLSHWGTTCIICGFDFEKVYGKIGKGFIHVHHLIPISQIGKTYQINPILDLIPVCPNCHSMIHRQNPSMTIDEIKSMIIKNK
ncbi:MAG: HNH endonuclease [Bacteroidota bacterium]|nr:HNH endonuclease [Bacteroidota bacterium]